MSVKIRLARSGAKKRPYYHIVVSTASAPRDGRFIEKIGTYNPLLQDGDESRIKINAEKASKWLANGAQPTEVVAKFFKKFNITAAK